MNFKSISDLAQDIRSELPRLNFGDYDLIVGIPRSGMIPASMIALYLNVPLMSLGEFLNGLNIRSGITRSLKGNVESLADVNNVLVVDDSILSGRSMNTVKRQLSGKSNFDITYLAVYSSEVTSPVDIYFKLVPLPRVFEWNIFHHSISAFSCFDIDGVLCVDPSDEQNDDGEKYIDFIREAEPLFLPTFKVDTLITNRLEKYRDLTEVWLSNYGVKYNNLVMLDLGSKAERVSQNDYYAHKSNFYAASKHRLFVESDMKQAIEISRRSKKAVYCVDNNVMISPDNVNIFVGNYMDKKKKRLFGILPVFVKRLLRKLF